MKASTGNKVQILIEVERPGRRWHLPALPTTLSRQFLSVLTTTLLRLADAQSEREATASQSGKSQGEARLHLIHTAPSLHQILIFAEEKVVYNACTFFRMRD